MDKPIFVFQSKVSNKAINDVVNTMENGWIGLGKKVQEFEEKFANYLGAKYAVGLNSATAALHIAIDIIENSNKYYSKKYFLTTPMTFISTNLAPLYYHLEPIWIDIIKNLNVDINKMIEKSRVTGFISHANIVHFAGNPIEKERIGMLEQNALDSFEIIQDCAHACGAKFADGTKVGSFGKFNVFSFHAVKNLASPDGGMLVTDDEEVYKLAKQLRWCGIDKDTITRTDENKSYSWTYNIERVGFKYHMNDVVATMCLAHLETLDEDNAWRRHIIKQYENNINYGNMITSSVSSSGHMAIFILPEKINRYVFMTTLKNIYNIHCGVHYEPNYHYKKLFGDEHGMEKSYCEMIWRKLVTLPCHLLMTENDIKRVVKSVNDVLKRLGRE